MKHLLKWRNTYYLVTTAQYIEIVKCRISPFNRKELPLPKATLEDVQKIHKHLKG